MFASYADKLCSFINLSFFSSGNSGNSFFNLSTKLCFKLSGNKSGSGKEVSDYYEEVIKGCDKKLATNWITGDLFAVLNKKNLSISQSPVSPKNLSSLIKMITTGKISGKIAKDVFEKMQDNDKDPHLIVEKEGLIQQSDPKELERIISEMLSKNQDKVTQYKSGKEKLFGYFVGEVMKISKGKANPQLVNEILKVKLK